MQLHAANAAVRLAPNVELTQRDRCRIDQPQHFGAFPAHLPGSRTYALQGYFYFSNIVRDDVEHHASKCNGQGRMLATRIDC